MITRHNFAAIARRFRLHLRSSARRARARGLAVNGQAGPRGTGPADNVGIRLGGLRRRTMWGLFLPAKTGPGRKTSF